MMDRYASVGWVVIVAITLVLCMYAAVYVYPEHSLKADEMVLGISTSGEVRLEALDRARRIGIGVVASLGGLLLIYVNWRRARAIEDQALAATEQARIANESQINERFSQAISQLGSARVHIRLGGIAALERVSYDRPETYGDTVLDVLSGFLRDRSEENRKAEKSIRSAKKADLEDSNLRVNDVTRESKRVREISYETEVAVSEITRTDTRAVGSGIGRLLANGETRGTRPLDLKACDLDNVILVKAYLRRANLFNADLRGANLFNTDISEANLSAANLSGANLQGAKLFEADLREANLARANLREADLRGAEHLRQQQLQSASNWELAYRNPEHAYGKRIRTHPDERVAPDDES